MIRYSFILKLAIALALLSMASALFCFYQYRKYARQYRALNSQYNAEKNKAKFELTDVETAFFKHLAKTLGYEIQGNDPTLQDIVRLSALLTKRYNATGVPPAVDHGYYRSLSPLKPPAESNRDIPLYPRLRFQSLDKNLTIAIDKPFTRYQYEIVNIGDQPANAPILYDRYLWNSVDNLIQSAGFLQIQDETDRAIAIWRFIAENRYHFYPVTEDAEEHDMIKYLSIYGYGLCDDTARALAKLANKVGLKGRVWGLKGHVVAEIFASGQWRLFDGDAQVYFYQQGNDRQVYSLDALTVDKNAFHHFVSLTQEPAFSEEYQQFFLTQTDNYPVELDHAQDYEINLLLRPNEKVVFTNYHWGKYFMSRYPYRPPKFYNGYFQYRLAENDMRIFQQTLAVEKIALGYVVRNPDSSEKTIRFSFSYPFPLVGGEIKGVVAASESSRGVVTLFNDETNQTVFSMPLASKDGAMNIDAFFSMVKKTPTYRYTIALILPPKGSITLRNDFSVITDFQFSEFALLKLRQGINSVHLWTPGSGENFQLNINTDE